MDNDFKDRIKSTNPIAEVVGQLIPLKKAGKDFKGLCPFHQERTASFFVSPSRQTFHCFGCGASGDVIDFIMRWNKVTFKEALKILSRNGGDWLPDPLPKRRETKATANVTPTSLPLSSALDGSGAHDRPLKYLEGRGVTDLQIALYGIRWAAQGRYRDRLIFPVYVREEIRGFAARAIGDAKLKYLFPKGTKSLFGYDIASGFRDCVLVEGVFDALRVGFDAIAILGSFLSARQLALLYNAGFKRITVMLDSDAFEKSIAICRQLESYFNVHQVILGGEGHLDPGELNHSQLRELIQRAPRFGSDESLREIVNGRVSS